MKRTTAIFISLAISFQLLAPVASLAQSPDPQSLSQMASLIASLQSVFNSLKSKVQAIIGGTKQTVQAQTADVTNGLVGHWKFDEGSGTSAVDSSGNNNIGTLTNGPTWTTGKIGGALSFDGTDDYVQTIGNELNVANNITMAAWIKADATNMRHIIWQGNASGNGGGAEEEISLNTGNTTDGASNRLQFFIEGTNDDINITTSFSDTTTWNHVVGVVSGLDTVAPQAQLYLNGISVGSDSADIISRTSWDTNLRIGRPGLSTRLFDGLIDEVRVYNRALTASEISTLYNYTGGPPDTIAPSISLTEPASGAAISGTITVSANASDNVGVAGVQFKLDGNNLGGEDATSPYSISWNTTTASNGSHTLTATARDAAGNTTTSSGVAVTVSNTALPADTTPPSTPSNLSATVISPSQINLSWAASTDNIGVTGYRVERCQGSTCTNFVQISTPTGTSYNDTGLSANTSYRYQVRAVDGANNLSGYSSIASAATQASTPPPTGSGGAPLRSGQPYAEATKCADSNVILCEDFDYPQNFTCGAPVGGGGLAYNWANPGLKTSLGSANCGSKSFVSVSTVPAMPTGSPTAGYVKRVNPGQGDGGDGGCLWGDCKRETADNSVGATYANGTPLSNDLYFRFQMYLSSDYVFPSFDNKIFFLWPNAYIDKPSANIDAGFAFIGAYCTNVSSSYLKDALSFRVGSNSGNFKVYPADVNTGGYPEHQEYCLGQGYGNSSPPVSGTNPPNDTPYPGTVFRFQKSKWYNIEFRYKLSSPGQSNGTIEAWINGTKVYSDNDLETCGSGMGSCASIDEIVQYFWYNIFQEQNTPAGYALVDNLIVSKAYIGPPSVSTADTTAPSAPTNLSATAQSSSQINLSWNVSTDNVGVTGYRVERCQGSSCTTFAQIATPTGASFNDTGLSANMTYRYQVRAADAAGNLSGYSSVISATTQPITSTKFTLNDRVQVSSGPLNVRSAPSISGTLLGTQSTGVLGTVISGPTFADGYWWWNINFDSGVDGWSAEDFLERYVPPSTGGGAPMSGPMGARAVSYVESICRTNPNVFFCEDFEDAATAPLTTPGVGPDCSGSWKNPGFVYSNYCWNQRGSVSAPILSVPGFSNSNNKVYNIKIANGTIDGYLGKGGQGKTYNDYYIRWQFYYTSDVQFPVDLDIKQMLSHPEVFEDPPSANYQNGIYFHEDYFCSGVGNFGDAIVLRYGPPYNQFPSQNEYCPPLAPGQSANNINAPRIQKNRWYTVEVHFRLGATASTGLMEAWLDGNLMYRANRANCTGSCPPMAYVYFTGYKSPFEPDFSGNVQYDNIVMSTSYIGPPSGVTTTPLVGDLNGDKIVNSLDWSVMNGTWATNNASSDLNRDGIVNSLDFSLLNANWGRTN